MKQESQEHIFCLAKDEIEDFEIVGENNFGSKIRKIDWKGILNKLGGLLLILVIMFMILK